MNTADRLAKIGEVIASSTFQNQRQMLEALSRQGLAVSRATLSRDLVRLGARRLRQENGVLKYVLASGSAIQADPAERIVTIASSVPHHLALELERRRLPGVWDILVGKRRVWVAASLEGVEHLNQYLKKRSTGQFVEKTRHTLPPSISTSGSRS